MITVGDDDTVRLWDVATSKPLGAPLTHQAWVNSAEFSPDGKRVVTTSDDNTAQVWNIPLDDTPWEALAARSPFVVTGGVIEQRVPLVH